MTSQSAPTQVGFLSQVDSEYLAILSGAALP